MFCNFCNLGIKRVKCKNDGDAVREIKTNRGEKDGKKKRVAKK